MATPLDDLELLKVLLQAEDANLECTIITKNNTSSSFLKVVETSGTAKHIFAVGNQRYNFSNSPTDLSANEIIAKIH